MSMIAHKLDVIRSIDGFEGTMVKNLTPSPTQEALFPGRGMYAGRCVSRASDGTTELGVSGHRVPYWLFRTSNLPSTGMSDPQAVADAPDLTYQDGREHVVLHFCGIEGLEIVTTEFVANSGTAYEHNQFLKAPTASVVGGTDADKLAKAGVVTNHEVVYGVDTIVGIVSETAYRKPHNINMLTLYTLFRPAIEGLPAGIVEPVWFSGG